MSGIAGIISIGKNSEILQQDFESFFSSILVNHCKVKHIEKLGRNGFIGVADLEGRTPKVYVSEDSTLKLFLWGEMFLKDSEAPGFTSGYVAILKLWMKKRQQFFQLITGDFVACFYDTSSDQITLFNSLYGMMPLYYSIKGKTLLFSSRLQSFIDYQGFDAKVDNNGMLQLLMFNYTIGDSTFLQNVKLLPAASIISRKKDGWIKEKYDHHTLLFNSPEYDFNNGVELVNIALSKSIKRIADIDSPFACAITGGWDGRLILSYLTKLGYSDFILYTYGKETHPDMYISRKLAKTFGFEHLPVVLDESFIEGYVDLAGESVLLSDGLRPANRGQYLLTAKKLAAETSQVISGNCGSNILKIIQGPGAVYNDNVVKLFQNDLSLEDAADHIYVNFFKKNPWIKPLVKKDEFIFSVIESEIIKENDSPLGRRFYHFLLTNIERKYFGTETSSYASYIYNYTPFIDTEFIESVVKTPYFGGHYPFLQSNPMVRVKLSQLYAKLMLANHKDLALFTSDRGFPITWFKSPQGRLAGYLKKKVSTLNKKHKDTDPFNHMRGLNILTENWNLNTWFFEKSISGFKDDTKVKALSWSYWYFNNFNRAE